MQAAASSGRCGKRGETTADKLYDFIDCKTGLGNVVRKDHSSDPVLGSDIDIRLSLFGERRIHRHDLHAVSIVLCQDILDFADLLFARQED